MKRQTRVVLSIVIVSIALALASPVLAESSFPEVPHPPIPDVDTAWESLSNLETSNDFMGMLSSNSSPVNVSMSCPTGQYSPETVYTFTCVYRDEDGYGDLKECNLYLNQVSAGITYNGVRLLYNTTTDMLYILSLDGSTWYGGEQPGSSDTIHNQLCIVHCLNVEVNWLGNGTDIEIKWTMEFGSGMGGMECGVWMFAKDMDLATSGWNQMGTIQFAGISPTVNTSLDPSQGWKLINREETYSSVYTDANGCNGILRSFFRVANVSTEVGVTAMFDRALGKMYLLKEDGTGWLGGYMPGTSNVIENSYCRLNCANSSAHMVMDTVTVNWALEWKTPVLGANRKAWMLAVENNYNQVGWTEMGVFTITDSVATPTFSPAAGSYNSAQDVTITCATDATEIYYTTNGSTPTTSSTLYTGPVHISGNTTLKAIAYRPDWGLASGVQSGSYCIDTTAPTVGVVVGPSTASSSPITVSYSGVTDEIGGSGLKRVELWYKFGSGGTWVNSTLSSTGASDTFSFSFPDGAGTYYFEVVAEDNAGNRSSVPSGDGDFSTVYTP